MDITQNTTARRALVVGLGVAGTATALRLEEIGWQVTVVERAVARRGGGYFIGLFGSGQASARRLGITDMLGDRTCPTSQQWEVDRKGNRHPGSSFKDFPQEPMLMLRGDVEDALNSHLPATVEVRFSTTPTRIVQSTDHVDVTLRDTTTDVESTEQFDLVVGADGLRSTVRRLTFGPDANFVHSLQHMIGACLLEEQVPGFSEEDGLVLAEPGRSVWTFPFKDHTPTLLFTYRSENPAAEFARAPIDSLRRAFGPEPTGELLGNLLDRFEAADTVLFDEVKQVRMRQWHHGRVALVGDAAWCMTLYSGLGAGSGLAGADLLGTVLERQNHDVPAALAAWNDQLRPWITYQSDHVEQMRMFFVPDTRTEQLRRSGMLRLQNLPATAPVMSAMLRRSPDMRMKNVDIAAR